ncbi:MAG: glucose-1-phosphate adenylyltransferase subunit GlgD [Eubacteriales bacterium]|nr:glucose-1-phosphate adenylyltransferase subunit GlgD [Eubacteriales bacterium]
MAKATGIIISSANNVRVEGMQDYRPMGAFSFLGRFRVIDFPISNMSNSDIDHIQCYVRENPRSLAEHIGNGSNYNINSKKGKMQLLFAENSALNNIYNTDISAFAENLNVIERSRQEYVVIAPSYMIYKQNYATLLDEHIATGADVTLLYHKVNNAKDSFLNCDYIEMNKQKGVLAIKKNSGTAANRDIFMDTYVMKKEIFVDMIKKAKKLSSVLTLAQIINRECEKLDIRGVAHRGFFATVLDLKSYMDANLSLLNYEEATDLFKDEWPIYTATTDACPTQYFEGGSAKQAMIANGCLIKGSVENSVIGRGVTVEEGAVIKNCVVNAYAVIGKGVHIENQIVDKWAQIKNVPELIGTPEQPGYVRRDDIL